MVDQYLTGNPRMDDKIAKALIKEKSHRSFANAVRKEMYPQQTTILHTIFTFDITPIGAPRMTQRDKWKNTRTDRAERYFQYKDDLNNLCLLNKFKPSLNMRMIFYIPFPDSWNSLTKKALEGKPHNAKPDGDNLVKGFLDALMSDDSQVWHVDYYKYWTINKIGRIETGHL